LAETKRLQVDLKLKIVYNGWTGENKKPDAVAGVNWQGTSKPLFWYALYLMPYLVGAIATEQSISKQRFFLLLVFLTENGL